MVGDVLLGVQHQHGNVRRFYRLHSFDNGEFFYCFIYFAATAHAGGVNNGEGLAFAFKINVDAVARGAGHVKRNHALFA